MMCKRFDEETLSEGVIKGLINFIPKEGDFKDLNYWRPITFLMAGYKVLAKTL